MNGFHTANFYGSQYLNYPHKFCIMTKIPVPSHLFLFLFHSPQRLLCHSHDHRSRRFSAASAAVSQVMAFSTATKRTGSLGTILYNSMLNSGSASQSQRSCGLANAISSVGTVSDIGLRLLPNLSFHGVHVQCINIGGGKGEIPDNKHLQIALQHIHGIGRARARQILSKLSIENKLARELTGRELYALREELNNYMCAHELNNQVTKDISRLMEIQCYRGIRHSQGLPCRGQRTHTNARTWKGKAIPVAGKKKA